MSTEATERVLEAIRREHESPAWTCLRCEQDHWSGSPDEGCPGCGFVQEVAP